MVADRHCSQCNAPEGKYLAKMADTIPEAGWVYCDSPADTFCGIGVVNARLIKLTSYGGELLCPRCYRWRDMPREASWRERRKRAMEERKEALTRPCPRCGSAVGEKCTNYLGKPKFTCRERVRPANPDVMKPETPSLFGPEDEPQ